MGGILAAWLAEIAIITYRGFERGTSGPIAHLPIPADYIGATVVYGALGLMGKTQAAPVAALLGWGFVVATLLNLWTPNHPTTVRGAKGSSKAHTTSPTKPGVIA